MTPATPARGSPEPRTPKPRAVIFDIGNVLVEWDPERFYDGVIGPDRRRALFAAVDLGGVNEAADAGAPFGASIGALADAHPDRADEILIWRDRWSEIFAPAIDRSVRLLRALRRAGVPVFALTNFADETFVTAQENYPFLEEFDRVFVSGRMKVIKPDPAIYAALEAETGLPPDALFFTDDKAENIAAAAARGWQTHHFTGPAGFADALVATGMLTADEAA